MWDRKVPEYCILFLLLLMAIIGSLHQCSILSLTSPGSMALPRSFSSSLLNRIFLIANEVIPNRAQLTERGGLTPFNIPQQPSLEASWTRLYEYARA